MGLEPSIPISGLASPQKMQLVMVGLEPLVFNIPPAVFAAFPEKVQLVMAGELEVLLTIAPPLLSALLPEKRQFMIMGEELKTPF